MRALYLSTAGQPPTLGELPDPTPGEGEVLVRVKAAAVNPIDNAIAAGMLSAMLPHEYPLVLGRDAAGVVVAVGEGVEDVQPGDEVLGHVPLAPPIQAGTIAELVVLPVANVTAKPPALDFTTAAALPLAGAAASAAVDAISPEAGQTVLVNGASGGVGSFTVQLLARKGVSVVATGSAADTERLRSLGATDVVDFTAGPVADQVRRVHSDGVDALVNLAGFTADDVPLAAVKAGGKVATTTGAPGDEAAEAAGVAHRSVMASPTREVVGPLAELSAAGDLVVTIDSVLPLEAATEGLATVAAGEARGKIVINVSE